MSRARFYITAVAAGALALAAGIVVATKSQAADKGGPVYAAQAAEIFPANPWTAIHASIGLGTGALTSDFGLGIDGYQLSGRLGGDVQINRIVIGVMADYAYDHTTILGNTTPKEWMVAARAGVLVTNDALIYGLAGERWLSVTGFSTQGVDVGGGIEVAMTKNWRLGIEYNHINYDALTAAREQTVTGRLIFALPR